MFNKKLLLNQAANQSGDGALSEEKRRQLKAVLLDMTADIDRVCRRNGLHLFLVGGSLLGAVRHKGFIPWDDDVDFGMTRADYQRLIEIFEAELGEKYMMRCPNSPWPNGNRFMQIFKKGTVLETFEGSTPLQPACVSLDIFPYDAVPENALVRKIKGIYCNALMAIASSVTEYRYPSAGYREMITQSFSGKILFHAQKVVGFLLSWRSPAKWFDRVDHAIRGKRETSLITSATGRRHYFGEIFPRDVFLPLGEMPFEHLTLYAPANPDAYLRHNYGDNYMTPPAQGSRESHFIKRLEL